MQITGNTLTEDTHNIRNIAIDKPSSPLLTTLKIIWNAVKGIFKKIGNFFKNLFSKNENKTTLTNHEIEMIQNAQQLYNPTVKKEETKANSLSDRDVTHHSSQAGSDIPPKNTLEKKKDDSVSITIKDPDMRDFHDTSQKMIETVLECVFEEKIKPEITNVKEGLGKLSEVLKIAGDLAIRIGDKAAKPLFEKLKGFSIEEKVKPDLLSLLNWLLKDGVKNDFENLLKERLKNEHDNEELLDKFTQPCIKWLLETDHSTPLSQAYTNARIPIQGNKEAIDKAFETAMLVLLDNKIEQYMNKYHAKFDESLPGIVHKMLIDNGKRISSILTQRMINVVENSSFPEMFNNLLYVALDQSEAIIAAEKAKENEMTNQNALYEKAKNVERIQTNTESEATNKSMLLAHKNKIDEVGKEEYIKAEAEKKALQTYTNQDVCHPSIAKLMLNPSLGDIEKNKVKEELFVELANNVIQILLPEQRVQLPNGEVKSVDGLVYLCSEIEIPPEFKQLAQEAIEISKEILTPETQGAIKKVYDLAWDIAGERIQEIIVAEVKKEMQKGIMIGARILFNQFITPNLMNELVGETILPEVQNQVLIAMGGNIISTNQNEFATLYHKLASVEYTNKINRNKILDEICENVYNKMKTSISQYKDEFTQLSLDGFKKIFMQKTEAIELGIRSYQNDKKIDSLESVKNVLEGYFKDVYGGNNPLYGELVVNMMYKLGNFGIAKDIIPEFFKWFLGDKGVKEAEESIYNLIKGMLSEQITHAMHPIQKSPQFLVQKATEQIKGNYLDKDKVKELLFGEKVDLPENEVKNKLQREINRTAKVGHDFLLNAISNSKGAFIKKPVVSAAIGNDSKKIEKLITDIYSKFFGNELMTHNMLIRGQEVVLNTLAKAGENLDKQNSLYARKVEKLPMIIPELFV